MKDIINIKKLIHDYQKYNEDGKVESTYRAVDEVSLDVQPGQFIAILGHNGSGKSTLAKHLNAILLPTEGTVYVDGKDTRDEEKIKEIRQTAGMVFQNPDNQIIGTVVDEDVAFGPENMGVPSEEIEKRVEEGLKTVEMWEYRSHSPNKLSGGQKQRVAIARALANNPRVLLLDEPLGALDLQLRRTMQLELKRLQKKLGITFIYITHDQEEAINMSDRIVVMNQGQFEQIGTPDEIYNHPKTSYVATFVGNANILKGKVVEINGSYAQVQIGNDTVSVYTEEIVKVGEQLTLAVRSENILLDEAEMENVVEQNEAEGTGRHLHATVKEKNFAAGQLRVLLALSDGTELTASRFGMNANIQPGQQIKWYFDPRNAIVVDREFKTKEPADMSGGNQ